MKIGDIVNWSTRGVVGIIVGFNKRGEGGKHFVHVLVHDKIVTIFYIDLEVITGR
jgi:hypothetical protein